MRRAGLGLVLILGTLLSVWIFLYRPLRAPEGMAAIPAGSFVMGSDEVDREGKSAELGLLKPIYLDEHPRRDVFLPLYYIDRTEVTNAAYLKFIRSENRQPPSHWKGGSFSPGRENYPVVNVNWYEANDYCRWAGKRLPTEAEWEKAARGSGGRIYPWGDTFDAQAGNVGQTGRGEATPVGSFPKDRSVYGVFDLAGNIMEWTADWYKAYPGSDYNDASFGERFRVARGDAFGSSGHYYLTLFSRASYRQNVLPEDRYDFLGFRCVRDG
ncbi:MAG TPA: formylglycine-generating enzyme family protein [Nitrospiria bacterium]|nr:formylglycine-generating enzyme family protein [Nitrospiria bacterium]